MSRLVTVSLLLCWLGSPLHAAEDLFVSDVAPIFQRRCLSCHNSADQKGEFSLETAAAAMDSGHIEPGDAEGSNLIEMITPNRLGKAKMPKKADPLSADQIAAIRKWIDAGAKWPKGVALQPPVVTDFDWWSLKPIVRSPVPQPTDAAAEKWIRTPIDAFILARMREKGLAPSSSADPRTLIRRLYFDLVGLPPPPAEVDAFVATEDPSAYEKLVDRLLASPHYGERWARHWLDVVHYGDTHGYDKDKLRPNAWPYRDYVIRAFNDDTPYGRFVKQQVAGDVLYPDQPHLIPATGFIAAGPWDFIGHVEVPASKIDGRVARNLDRDDMVVNTMQTFCSVTVGCARCHNHKFDPITQEDYYSLQAVFAAVGRNDRPYDVDPKVVQQRLALTKQRDELAKRKQQIEIEIRGSIAERLAPLDQQIQSLESKRKTAAKRPEFGYHSAIVPSPDKVKWVQVDLGAPTRLDRVILVGCHDVFNNIGAGFGFPVRFKVEVASDAEFKTGVETIADHTAADYANPGVNPVEFTAAGRTGRFIRVTATKLVNRLPTDFILAIAELQAWTPDGANAAKGKSVTALDSIEAPPRWEKENLTDDIYFTGGLTVEQAKGLAAARAQRQKLIESATSAERSAELKRLDGTLADLAGQLDALPKSTQMVYAAATRFKPSGNHRPSDGKLAPIHVLIRGVIDRHGKPVGPGTLRLPSDLPARFDLPEDHTEGDRRIALARWIADPKNPLTWRSIVNRIWLYHFGRGIVNSPNDLGHMGQQPSHPRLIDWLAAEFRDGGRWITSPQSIKQLHKLIVTSSAYRQASGHNQQYADIDSGNQFLWRANRRRLEAEAIRDTVLVVAGKLDPKMYGPGFRDFVVEQPAHSPQFVYEKHNPDDPKSHRRSVYRFLPRSQPQPFMETLDCADPSQQVARRDETVTALSALALLNNKFMVRMAEHFAARLEKESDDPTEQIENAFRLAVSRPPSNDERAALVAYANEFGLPSACRVILNLNEFVFVD